MAIEALRLQRDIIGSRICVIGCSGAGKTTVAEELAARLVLKYVCNDAMIWRSGWQPAPPAEVYAEMDAATSGARWVFDGNLIMSSPSDMLALARCDTIVWLDLPRPVVHWRVLHRTLKRAWRREPLWHGNRETWRAVFGRDSMFLYSLTHFTRSRRSSEALFMDRRSAGPCCLRFRSQKAVSSWLLDLPTGT